MNIHTYQSASGRDLIRAYIDTLTELEQTAVTYIYCMLVENKKTRPKRKIKAS